MRNQRGLSLLETMIAVSILLVAMAAIMSLFTVAVSQNTNQGEFGTRATEYCQDKMEQLLALSYGDSTTNTAVYPPAPTGGRGLGGLLIPVGNFRGGIDPNAPVTFYVDYLDANGNLLTSSTGWFYKRQWRIDQIATDMKRISVLTIVRAQAGKGPLPSTTLVSLKANLP
jgi:prepilin-type N-terminal cleavage/methylation domain-containing protein